MMLAFSKIILLLILNTLFCFSQSHEIRLINIDSLLHNPIAFSIDKEENIYLLSSQENALIKIDRQGKVLKRIGGLGWGTLNFDKPIAVDISDGLNVFVSDFYNNRIQRFNKNLEYINTLSPTAEENTAHQFRYPTQIGVDRFSNLFVYDSENGRFLKYNSNNKVERIFGGYESGEARLFNPIKLVIDKKNNLYILDNNKINIYDNWGTFLKEIKNVSSYRINTFTVDDEIIYITNLNELIKIDNNGNVLQKYDINEYLHTNEELELLDIENQDDYLYLLTTKYFIKLQKYELNKSGNNRILK